jgi:trehalose 6-phosphate phosphatase
MTCGSLAAKPELPPLPELRRTALLLDLDGTLLDIAPTPDGVVVPPGLVDTLRMLRGRLDGALAVITGRPIETIDQLLHDAPYAVAGEHGGAVRHAPGDAVERAQGTKPSDKLLDEARKLERAHSGALLEVKASGFTLHYRAVPDAGPELRAGLEALLRGSTGLELLSGKMMWEVRPHGVDKGNAVRALMARAPFAGRVPVFIGDDVTDEAAIEVAEAMGGVGLRVADAFGEPANVRAWLASLAQ